MIGASLNQYRITAPIGAGGMGEVFRTGDTRLNRDSRPSQDESDPVGSNCNSLTATQMNRRTFFNRAALLPGAALSTVTSQAAADDDGQVQSAIKTAYSVYFQGRDKEKYRSLLSADYILIEHGELINAASEIAAMPKPENPLKRTDYFDFKSVKVHGDIAYAIYDLKYEVSAGGKSRRGHCLESAILRNVEGRWLMCLLHSTRMPDHQSKLQ